MLRILRIALLGLTTTALAMATLETKTVRYDLDGTTFESTIVYDAHTAKPLPGILMVPNWMGPTENALEKAKMVAGYGYVVMITDMYGVDVRPTNGGEAAQAAGFVRGDRALMRARAAKGLEVLRGEGHDVGLDREKVAAIGFCFGGGTVLELGRSGADLAAVVSFHGDLVSPTLEADAANTQAKVLVLHGAADPYVPRADVERFTAAMLATEVDWQLVEYSQTVHSFTNPEAAAAGQSEYNPVSAARAFVAMRALLDEIWD
ncbi:dienelactone hydrolase family protein [Actomonas aquatica]|uniref:Dienelactone hydrolase family protein n=1 Tax=Actomonas aquatica TaxID=2866162 RepID=A0ABZ1C4J9_9BACT|nr:dienelactone hydrolase family protein [Opitutus sp. WL0086]WRQ86653.1 dienelactone hydrolase family protein [Opitutus sp. WL0086]